MSNRQADSLRREVLGLQDEQHAFVCLKPIALSKKALKLMDKGSIIDGWDPLHLRIVQGDRVLARAKLGEVNALEAIHIVSDKAETYPSAAPGKKHLLEARLRLWDGGHPKVGDLIEYRDPLSPSMLLLIDHRPYGLGRLIGYNGEPAVQVTEIFGG